MTRRSPVIQWLCLSVLLGFLSSAISSAAEEANKAPPPSSPTAQNSTEPGPPPQLQEKTPVPQDPKGGEAAALASVAKFAVDMNNETVKRIEAFYANTVQNFAWHITIVATLVGLLGIVSVGVAAAVTATQVAKRQANKTLRPIVQEHSRFAVQSNQILADYETIKSEFETIKNEHTAFNIERQKELQEFEALRNKFTEINETALKNVSAVPDTIIAWTHITNYMNAPDKSKFEGVRDEARRLIDHVLNEIDPTNELVLSLAYSLSGILLYFDKEFENALDCFRKAFDINKKNSGAAFNRACCACMVADELDEKGVAEKTDVVALENEALSSLIEALKLQPWRKAEARSEGETGDMRRLREHPQFKLLIF